MKNSAMHKIRFVLTHNISMKIEMKKGTVRIARDVTIYLALMIFAYYILLRGKWAAHDQLHVAMTKRFGLVISFACQRNSFFLISSIKKLWPDMYKESPVAVQYLISCFNVLLFSKNVKSFPEYIYLCIILSVI